MLFPRQRSSRAARGAQGSALVLLSGLLAACNAIFGVTGPEESTSSSASASSAGGHDAASVSSSSAGGGGTGGAPTTSSVATTGSGGAPAPVCDGMGPGITPIQWSRHAGGFSGQSGDGVAITSDGGVVVGGQYADDQTIFTGSPLNYPGGSNEGYDLYVAKYDESGLAAWQTWFNGPGTQFMTGLVADHHDNTLVAGYFQGTVAFGPSNLYPVASDTTISPDAYDSFVVKLGPGGNPLWSRRLGGPNDDILMGIAVDSADNVIVAGVTYGGDSGAAVELGCGTVDVPAGKGWVFLSKLAPDGSKVWCKPYAVDVGYMNYWNGAYGLSVAVDPHDNIILAGGAHTGVSSFGNGTLNGYGGVDTFVFVAKPDGSYGWAGSFGDENDQWVSKVATDACGNVFVAGGFRTSVTLGSQPVIQAMDDPDGGTSNYYRNHIFIAKLVPGSDPYSYVPAWVKGFWDAGGVGYQQVNAIAVDPWGDVVVAGSLYDDLGSKGVDFGDDMPVKPPGPNGDTYGFDAFLVKLGAVKGSFRSSKRYGGTDFDFGTALAIDGAGHMAFAGAFSEPLDFGKGLITPYNQDVFVLKYAP